MTYDEAAAVTSFGTAFQNSNITHFDEIEFFSSVTNLGNGCFSRCNLRSLVIPEGVTTLGNEVFARCNSLISVSFPASITSIDYNPFSYAKAINAISLHYKTKMKYPEISWADISTYNGTIYVPVDGVGFQAYENNGYGWTVSYTL